ncbi:MULTISPECIES: RluA family pseudouridine synthase [Bacillus]|uniref:Pseudouridine synthase n=2 Tax=Bacillus TaxID=1386 RepID=A0A0M3R8Z1_9BACI|nr:MULTISPECIES: RluA family pseudouridine synthase [Bacillus]ALC80516.1 pseudouridine synthase [Bacillus gobiensis]MBP1083590.1 23S rRNA pseudouridine1911/1915/1917 synthase [Bacillus capparidis]MED1094783.1 RluA family pseudouridine synthase [Bacillus capparidis]
MQQIGRSIYFAVSEKDAGSMLFTFLAAQACASKKLIQYWIANRKIKQNQSFVSHNAQLNENDSISIDFYENEPFDVVPEYGDLPVLFEDDHLIVINKPAGLATHPNEAGQTGTLANLIAFYFQMNGEERRIRHVHRLDQDTSGAIVFAKHRLALALLDQQMAKKQIKRTYLAIAEGKLKNARGKIDQPIGRDRYHSVRRRVSQTGQSAVTNFIVKGYDEKKDLSLLELQLDTGRTHQIRVHSSFIGHPLAGDTLYGGSERWIKRQALHSESISFIHPITKEELFIHAPPPKDMDTIFLI